MSHARRILSRTLIALAALTQCVRGADQPVDDPELKALMVAVQKAGSSAKADDLARLADAYEHAGRPAEAAGVLARAIAGGYGATGANQRLGGLFEAAGQFDKAALAYKAAAGEAGIAASEAASRELSAANVINHFLFDQVRANKAYLGIAKQWPGSEQAKSGLLAIWNAGDREDAEIRRQRPLAQEQLLRQFPGDPTLAGHLSDFLARTRGNPRLALEVYDLVIKAQPNLTDHPDVAGQHGMVLHAAGQHDLAHPRLLLAFEKSGNVEWLWQGGHGSPQLPQRAAMFALMAEKGPGHPEAANALWLAQDAGLATADALRIAAIVERQWAGSADRLARVRATQARAETDPAKRVARWLEAARLHPWALQDHLTQAAIDTPALSEGLATLWQDQRTRGDGAAISVGGAYGRSLAATAGDDPAKLARAREVYQVSLIEYGLVNDQHAHWISDRLAELLRHNAFDAAAVETTYDAVLGGILTMGVRRHLGDRGNEVMGVKQAVDQGAKLRERAHALPTEALARSVVEAAEGTNGEIARDLWALAGNADLMPRLSPAQQGWVRGTARYYAEHDGEMRNRIPEMAHDFYDQTKDPNWASDYVGWIVNIHHAAQFEAAATLAKELLAGAAKDHGGLSWQHSAVLSRLGRHRESADVLTAFWKGDFVSRNRDELWHYCANAGRGGDRENYIAAWHVLTQKGEWDYAYRGLWEHGIPDDWRWPLVEKLVSITPRRDLLAECLTRLAEAQRGADFAAFQLTAARVRVPDLQDQAHQQCRILLATLQSAQERKDEELEKRTAQELFVYVQAHGQHADANQFGTLVRRVIEARLPAWDKEDPAKAEAKKLVWFQFLIDHGGCTEHTTWAARRVYDLKRAKDPIQGGLALQRLVRTGWRERPEDFDRVLGEITTEMQAGRFGLAAGAFQHMAVWFVAARVGGERIQAAQRLATSCLGKLGMAQEIDERDPRAPLLRANALIATGDEAEAYRLATQNLQLLEDNLASAPSELVLLVARNQIREEKYDAAKRLLGTYQRFLGDNPSSVDAAGRTRFLIGEALYHEGNHQAALLEFQGVVAGYAASGSAIDAALRIGDCFYAQRQVAQARAAYDQLLFNDAKDVRIKAKFRIAVLASSEGQQDEAFRMFRELAADNPPKDLANQLYLDWGKLLIGSSRLKEAEDVITLVGLSTNREPIAPGEPLRITLQDTYLQASQNRTSVPVLVKSSNGDQEELELTLSQDIKGFFTGAIQTGLGAPTPGNRVLEVAGDSTISYDYTPDFKLGRANLVIGAGDIGIAANAEMKASSAFEDVAFVVDEVQKEKALDSFLARFDAATLRQEREIAGSASRTFRDRAQIKPGNPFYVAVQDPDQDLGAAADVIVAQVESSGDRVQIALTETEAHSGIFVATVPTGLKPADVRVSDAAPGVDPLVLLSDADDAAQAWTGVGDNQPGKSITVDMKAMTAMDRFTWSRGLKRVAVAAEPIKPPEPLPGLFGSFFEGTDFTGRRVYGAVDVPSFVSFNVPNHGSDNFCDRWIGEIEIPADGTWTLGLIGDDGVRLTVAGKRLVDAWVGQGATLYAGDLPLSAGWYPIIIEHYNGGGPSHLDLVMGKAGDKPIPVPRTALRTKGAGSSGGADNQFGVDRRVSQFRVEVSAGGTIWTTLYSNAAGARSPLSGRFMLGSTPAKRPIRSTRDAMVALTKLQPGAGVANGALAIGSTLATPQPMAVEAKADAKPESKKPEKVDWFGGGVLLIPKSGSYEFAVRASGRCWLMIGDQLVVEKDRDEPAADGEPRWRGRVEDLPFGHAPIRLIANSDVGLGGVELLWKPPGAEAFTPIPTAALADGSDADIATLTGQGVASVTWMEDRFGAEIRFPAIETRFVRMVIDAWEDGDAPAVASVRVHHGETLVMPKAGIDYRQLAANDTLELSAGDNVAISYIDEKNKQGRVDVVRARLAATYHNGSLGFLDARNRVIGGQLTEKLFERYRFKAGERVTVQVVDYDRDVSDKPDNVAVVFTSAAGQMTVQATETKAASGVFQAEIATYAIDDTLATAPAAADKLGVKEGEQISATYLDEDNTVPGAPTKRITNLRESVDGGQGIAIVSSRATRSVTGDVVIEYGELSQEATIAAAPVIISVTDPGAMISAASTVRVRLATAGGASVDIELLPDDSLISEGVFSGTVQVVLGDANAATWRLPNPADIRASAVLVGVANAPEGAEPVLPVQGGETIVATYLPGATAKTTPEEIAAQVALPTAAKASGRIATAGELAALTSNQQQAVTQLHVGGDLHLRVIDADSDLASTRDVVTVRIAVASGDTLDLSLEETESHSGVFSASAPLVYAAAPDLANQSLEAVFGDTIAMAYIEDGAPAAALTLPVAKGYDGVVAIFAKRFGDDALAAKTQVRLAECFFELYKNHREEVRKLKDQKGKDKEESRKRLEGLIADELDQGMNLLTRTIRDYADSQEQDQLLYLLGNFEQESDDHQGAIARYQHLLAAFPDSVRAPEAQYKIAQCYEQLKRFDEAWDGYVRLAYRWPTHELVGDAMVRIGLYYRNRAKGPLEEAQAAWAKTAGAKDKPMPLPEEVLADLRQAAAVYGKFVDRFPDHAIVEKIALAQGDCWFQAGDYLQAKAIFDRIVIKYPASAAKGLYWAGSAALEARQVRDCFLRYSQLLQSYPEATESKYARGKMASDDRLKQLRQQIAKE